MNSSRRSVRRPVGVVILLVLAAGGLAACGGTADPSVAADRATAARASGVAVQGDVMFAQMMVPHHEQAVEMADLALDERAGASDQVRALATQIAAAQGPEIETMQRWLVSWGAPASAPMGHSMPGVMGEQDMESLAVATGADFDRMWLTMMVAHHEGAITMADDVLGTTADDGVRSLAQGIVDGQEAEIATMKGLLS